MKNKFFENWHKDIKKDEQEKIKKIVEEGLNLEKIIGKPGSIIGHDSTLNSKILNNKGKLKDDDEKIFKNIVKPTIESLDLKIEESYRRIENKKKELEKLQEELNDIQKMIKMAESNIKSTENELDRLDREGKKEAEDLIEDMNFIILKKQGRLKIVSEEITRIEKEIENLKRNSENLEDQLNN
ncbi:MAG: hypothetical protein WCG45_02560 [bacterium]